MLDLQRPDSGVLFVVSGPSGVGKSTVIRAGMAEIPNLSFSVSATTRRRRAGEEDGVDYHFVSAKRFVGWVHNGAFLEHAKVYEHHYGTLRAPTEEALASGDSLILDIDVEGARQIRAAFPSAVHIMIIPPTIGTLRQRLLTRGTDSAATIELRMEHVLEQLGALGDYDYLVLNDDLDAAVATFQGIVLAQLACTARRRSWVRRFQR